MLFFFDETFRNSLAHPGRSFGGLCGIGIPEREIASCADEVFHLKRKLMGREFAENEEIKGKELFKNYVFGLEEKGIRSRNLDLGSAIIEMVGRRRLPVIGCVCFESQLAQFHVDNVAALDKTFRYVFERIDLWMKIQHPDQKALLVFDDRDYGINQRNSEAITRFFQRSQMGARLDSIIQTPFFAISQSHNIGLQLADLVTTVIGLRFASHESIKPFFSKLKRSIPDFHIESDRVISGLKVIRGNADKKNATSDPEVRGRDKKAQRSSQE
jgi:hypothetical protein